MAELKPCPFCGGEASRLENSVFGHYVSCKKCRARTDYYNSIGVAARAWNRRAGDGK